MRHHVRAVILLGGWLLMLPPMKQTEPYPGNVLDLRPSTPKQEKAMIRGITPDLDAPITRWTQATAFDTAKECETARTKHLPTKAGTPLPAGFVLAEEDTQAPPAAPASRALDAIPGNTPIKNLPVLPARLPPDWLPPDAFDLDAPGEVMADTARWRVVLHPLRPIRGRLPTATAAARPMRRPT